MKDFMLIGVHYVNDEELGLVGVSNNIYLGTVKSNVKAQIGYFDDYNNYDYFILETWSKGKRIEEEYYNEELGWHK